MYTLLFVKRDEYKFEDTLTHYFDDISYETLHYRASNKR